MALREPCDVAAERKAIEMENPKSKKKKLALKLKTVRSLDLERVSGGGPFTTINTRDLRIAGGTLADPPPTQPKSNYPNVCATRCGDGVLCPGDSKIAIIDLRTINVGGGGRLQSLVC